MKYISHIKELVSGIIENETVTRDTEAYDALTALFNHLDTLEEVHKYMPYKDPGPVIEKLEQSLAKANTDRIRIRDLYVKECTTNIKISQDLKNAQAEIQELTRTKDLYEVAKHKLLQFQSQIENLNKELAQKGTHIEELLAERKDLENNVNTLENQIQEQSKALTQKQEEINFLVGILSEEQLGEHQEYLRNQLPDDQPSHGPKRITKSWKRPKRR